MKIVTTEQLREMPIGTIFCELDKWGNFREDFRIITDRNPLTGGFSGTLPLYPTIEEDDRFSLFARKENEEWLPQNRDHIITEKEVPCEWITDDETDFEHDKNEIFAVFNKDEVKEMIKCLQWALSDCEGNEPSEQREIDIDCEYCEYRSQGECKGVREMWNIKPLADYDECPCLNGFNKSEGNDNAST